MKHPFKNIIITGASSGLGAALARKYAARDIHLGLIGRNEPRLAETVNYCKQQGAIVTSCAIDVRERERLVQWIADFDNLNPIDLVIANAGVMHTIRANSPLEPQQSIDEIIAVNVSGVIATVNPVLNSMARRGKGSVAIISSLSAFRGLPIFPAYSASKAAIKSYYEAIRGNYTKQGVYISVVCPGYISTQMTGKLKLGKNMLMNVDSAAGRIQQGIDKQRPLISFPWYHSVGLQLLRLLPETIADRILLLFFKM